MNSNSITLTGMSAGNVQTIIDYTKLAKTADGSIPINFTYSIWFYVNDWNYGYGKKKVIFGRMTAPSTGLLPNDISGSGPCPLVVLGEIQNTLKIFLTVYPNTNLTPNASTGQINSMIHECSLMNIPIQKWVNLLVSVYGRTLDLYLDGKLVRTCVLSGVAKIDATAPVYITPNGGFSGWTSKFQYWPNATDPQQAWDIYSAGYGASSLGNLFGQYKVKISLMQNDTEDTSITI
jgi:hypothetical protein